MMLSLSTKIIAVALGLSLASPLYAVEIINNVSSSASTGGNSAGSGEVIQGESKAQVKIYTDVDEEVTGPEAKIEKSVNVISSTDLGQASSSVTTTATTSAKTDKINPII